MTAKEQRELVSREELDRILTDQLQAIEDLEDATIHVQNRLAEPDPDGCNWSDVVVNAGSKANARFADQYARQIVNLAQKRYNLVDDD